MKNFKIQHLHLCCSICLKSWSKQKQVHIMTLLLSSTLDILHIAWWFQCQSCGKCLPSSWSSVRLLMSIMEPNGTGKTKLCNLKIFSSIKSTHAHTHTHTHTQTHKQKHLPFCCLSFLWFLSFAHAAQLHLLQIALWHDTGKCTHQCSGCIYTLCRHHKLSVYSQKIAWFLICFYTSNWQPLQAKFIKLKCFIILYVNVWTWSIQVQTFFCWVYNCTSAHNVNHTCFSSMIS